MYNDLIDVLSLMADMESCFSGKDNLTYMIEANSDNELSEEDLQFVSAAGSQMKYKDFLRRYNLE